MQTQRECDKCYNLIHIYGTHVGHANLVQHKGHDVGHANLI